jgi:hypothetical protein
MYLIILSISILFLLFPNEIFLYSETILGKMMAVLIIIYCTYENVIYGLFMCIIVIWFYQSDMLDRFHYRYNEYFTTLPPLNPQVVYVPNKPEIDIQSLSITDNLSLDKVYPNEISPVKKESEKIFRNQHCSKELDVMYKTSKIIHKEDISQLFPEISFLDDIQCNPCDDTCRFRLGKINQEIELMPKDTKQNDNSIWEWAQSWFIDKNEPYVGVGYVASYL